MNDNKSASLSWIVLMAWRDSRRNRSRLLLFISSVILGIGALVAIYSLGDNMRENIDTQAATLIGADLEISGNTAMKPVMKHLIDSLGDERSEQQSFSSMVYFMKNGGTRLVQVRALAGGFPYYGELETAPVKGGRSFLAGREALVDKTLMLQYHAETGDLIKIGDLTFTIAGTLMKAPGQTALSASIAPVVYIPLRYLDQTGLSQKGSRINYTYFFKYNNPGSIAEVLPRIAPRLETEGMDYETIETQKEKTGRYFSDLTKFLSLVGFIALLLGCIGVASAIHIYVKEKLSTIALLRCMGVKASTAFLIYLVQILGIGFIGSVLGAALGIFIQQFLPLVLKDIIPIPISTGISWRAVGEGVVLGVTMSLLFALLPLLSVRKVSPLGSLRMSFEEAIPRRDPATWLTYGLIVLFIFTFNYLQLHQWKASAVLTAGITAAFLVLTGMAALLMLLVRRLLSGSWNYLWRQGLVNLYRPNNQTIILIVSIGLGTAFICMLFFMQAILLNRLTLSSGGNQPNIVLFDIQPAQKTSILQIANQHGLVVSASVPIVNMRLESVNGRTASGSQQDTSSGFSDRLFKREYRVTYRDSLTASEEITAGKWTGVADQPSAMPAISLEQGFAKRFRISIGDTMAFNVQGAIIPTVVGSFRKVNWNRMQTNFVVVFPKGVIDDAPQFHVLLAHVPTDEASASFQQAVVRQYPNVSIIDLALVLKVLDDIIQKAGFVIRFMAAFSILTGIVVLINSVLISKYQRIRENVLLRTLGATRKQVLAITALEYFFLGALAALTGILLSFAGSWAWAHYSFEIPFTPPVLPVLIIFFSISLLTVAIGLANSRSALNKPPLEVLRQEV